MTKKCILKNGPLFIEQGGKWRFLGVMNPKGVSWREHADGNHVMFALPDSTMCDAGGIVDDEWQGGAYAAMKNGARFTQDMVHAYVLDGKLVVPAGRVETTEVKV